MLVGIGALALVLFFQSTIRVPADAPTIQAAIDAAQAFDTVLVAPGTYVETIDFLGKPITVRSETGPRATIIDGSGGSYLPVVSFRNGEGPESVLRGFTVTGGDGRSRDAFGGGISCAGESGPFTSPTIAQCFIIGNRSIGSAGGGVSGNPLLEDCRISGNFGAYEGGGVWGAPVMRRCVVSGNESWDGGGVFLIAGGANVLLEDCVVTANRAYDGAHGGGVYIGSAGAVLRRCLVAGNIGESDPPGLYSVGGAGVCASAPALLERCTIVGNHVVKGSLFGPNHGGVYGNATLVDCIVRGNDEVELAVFTTAVSYSNVEGGFPGTGNIDLDPRFVDASGGDYRLAAGSPCIDAGDPNGALDPDGTRADLGAFYYPQANVILRNGSGVNRVCFSSLTLPFVGSTWNGRVDATGHANATISGFLVFDRPRPAPLPTPAGELLIDLGGVRLLRMIRPSSGAADYFQVPIPADSALVGFAAYAQAFVLGGATELCNGLDFKFGN